MGEKGAPLAFLVGTPRSMVRREAITFRRLAGSLLALGVLAGTPVAVYAVPSLGHVVLGGGLAFVTLFAAALLAGRLLWPGQRWTETAAFVLSAALLAAVAFYPVAIVAYFVTISASLCDQGSSGFTSLPLAGDVALVVGYLAVGVWGFQRPTRVLWAWPLAMVCGYALALAAAAVVIGGSGFCET